MPSRWEICLGGPRDAAIPLAAPQAVVSAWLDDSSRRKTSDDARSAHGGPARAWACGPIRALPPGADGEDAVILQVRLLDDTLAGRLQQAAVPGKPVRFGAYQFRVAAPARETGRVSWADLRRWPGERAWQVRFLTPVCLRRGNRTSPWPAPDSIARSLADRWRKLEPGTAPSVAERDRSQVWVSDIDGRSQAQILTRRVRRNGQLELVDEVISGFHRANPLCV